MKIYSMTATFGKLEHQTLTLEPGLNVIPAPNEWGKSTWCAFLVCMLYGIATKDRTTQTALADKERYAPWSGSPMSGKIDLQWNGLDITIERSTKGRIPFGEFKAYETATGLPVPELSASNCGEVLLGVEKSVFTKSAFIRMADMPVSDSEALRRRLNALVTTGDESGESDALEQKLKDLRNRCRHNKTGQLPQAEAQRDALIGKLNQLHDLQAQTQRITQGIELLDEQILLLENHKAALAYKEAAEDAQRVEAAQAQCEKALQAFTNQETLCSTLPSREAAEEQILHLEQLRLQQEALQEEPLPTPPVKPEVPGIFTGLTPEQAIRQTSQDHAAFLAASQPLSPAFWILSCVCIAVAVVAALWQWWAAIPFLLAGICLMTVYLRRKQARNAERTALEKKYSGVAPEKWVFTAQAYDAAFAQYAQQESVYNDLVSKQQIRIAQLKESITQATGGCSLSECLDGWRDTLDELDELPKLHETYLQAKAHAETLSAMVKAVPAPVFPDTLTYSLEDTLSFLADAKAEHRQKEQQQSNCLGQMEAIGQHALLEQQLEEVQTRIGKLQDIYDALTLAIDTLGDAANDLQRRFAPQISNRAQSLFSRLTGGRYDRITLTEDLRMETVAQGETTLRTALWRSDGTADQLYFALRLAVADELTPECPLVLDDAFVRFDDTRMAAAMEVLKDSSKTRQVILFTCHGRESTCL